MAYDVINRRIFDVEPSSDAIVLAERYGYSSFIVERFLRLLGRLETVELLEANEEPMPETIRCNDYLIDCGVLAERLEEKGFSVEPIPFIPHGIEVLEAPFSIGASSEYLKGYYYIQDPGSMIVVYALEPRGGELILDAAAAPGGKATQIQQFTRDSSLLVAIDLSRSRTRALRSHLQRMGFQNYIIIRGDSRVAAGDLQYDRILLDAPSSGEGIIRKDPSRKTSRAPRDLRVIHEIQYSMLSSLVDRLKPGGTIVYAACSTAVEEGEYVITRLLWSRNDIRVEEPEIIGSPGFEEYNGVTFDPQVKRCKRLWPHRHGTEGFFICRLRRSPS